MAKILVSQADVNSTFKEMEKGYGALNKKQQAYAVREMGRIKVETSALIAEFADGDGLVKRSRLTRLLSDMGEIEQSLRDTGSITIGKIVEDTSVFTTDTVSAGVGLSLSKKTSDVINKNVVEYTVNRFGEDGLVLSDRLWGVSGEIRDNLSTVIRTGIIKGDSVNDIIPKIRNVYDNESWKIRRLARNESVTAHRAAISYNAIESDIVKWVEFHAGDDRSESCVDLASEDRYGKGSGVFKPEDSDLFMPHVNCTGYTTYVLDESWL